MKRIKWWQEPKHEQETRARIIARLTKILEHDIARGNETTTPWLNEAVNNLQNVALRHLVCSKFSGSARLYARIVVEFDDGLTAAWALGGFVECVLREPRRAPHAEAHAILEEALK